jgi:hypothetical protein
VNISLVCDKVKSTEILSSMKSSKLSQKTFTKMGQVRHQSLEDDGDEEDDHKILLGRSDEDNSSKLTVDRESSKTDDLLANAKFGSSSGRGKSLIKTRLPTRLIDNDFEKEDDHFSKSRTPRGIRFPFLK